MKLFSYISDKLKISKSLLKEIARYAVSFFFAWLVSALISDFPFFKSNIIQSISLDTYLRAILMNLSKLILSLVGIESQIIGSHLKTFGSAGVVYAYGCLGFRELAFFVVFIALQSGSLKNKLWYIPSGIILLTSLNLTRIIIIILGQHKDQDLFQPLHDIVTPVIMYPAILFLWLFWLTKYGETAKSKLK